MKREYIPEADKARLYELAKARWVCEHPGATPAEYTAAMRAIAKRIGF